MGEMWKVGKTNARGALPMRLVRVCRGVLFVSGGGNRLHIAMVKRAFACGAFFVESSRFEKSVRYGLAIGTKRLVAFIMTDWGSFTLAHAIRSLNEDGFALAAIDAGFADLMGGCLTTDQHGGG